MNGTICVFSLQDIPFLGHQTWRAARGARHEDHGFWGEKALSDTIWNKQLV